jgi:histidine triad (HIT) family protein
MKDTVFAKILQKEFPAGDGFIYEDEDTFAFLDIAPNTSGHTLVIPKKPFENIFDVDDETLSAVMRTVRKVANAIKAAGLGEGVNIIFNNETAAEQAVFHMHAHVIPRTSGDGFWYNTWPHTHYAPGEGEAVAEKIRNAMS